MILEDDIRPRKTVVLVDGHVHLHDAWDVGIFLSEAHQNFARVSKRLGNTAFTGVLVMVDAEGQHGYRRIVAEATSFRTTDAQAWTLTETDETVSTRLRRDHSSLVIIAGRQLRSVENLEVLAMGVDVSIEEHRPLTELVADITAHGGVAIIPWGFGKWSGKRGRILRDLLGSARVPFVLGDNGNRPALLPAPSLFRLARSHGLQIIPGSDPLPFRRERNRAGTFGFVLGDDLDVRRPAADLKSRLSDSNVVVQPYGNLERPLRFALNQTAMQLMRISAERRGRR